MDSYPELGPVLGFLRCLGQALTPKGPTLCRSDKHTEQSGQQLGLSLDRHVQLFRVCTIHRAKNHSAQRCAGHNRMQKLWMEVHVLREERAGPCLPGESGFWEVGT